MQILLEAEVKPRLIGGNPFNFMMQNYIPNGSFVSIGYIKDDEFKIGPTTQKRITPENDAKLTEWIKSLAPSKFRNALVDFQNSEKYQLALEGKVKTAPFFFVGGDCHVIKVNRFIMNWKNAEALAKWYGTRSDAEKKVRAKYGFGGPEDEYAEDDWRRKHGGIGINREIKAKGRQGNRYGDEIQNTGFYANLDNPNKLSIRLIENPKAYADPVWLLVDGEGNIEVLNNELMGFLISSYKAAARKVATSMEEISADEQAFLAELQSIKNWGKHENTLLLDKILYFTGTTIKEDGTKEPFTWLNKDIIAGNDDGVIGTFPYLRNAINKIVDRFIKQDTKTLEQKNKEELLKLTESQMRNKRRASLFFDIFTPENYKRKLNESLTPKRKRSLNESLKPKRKRSLNESTFTVEYVNFDGDEDYIDVEAKSSAEAERKAIRMNPDIDEIIDVYPSW